MTRLANVTATGAVGGRPAAAAAATAGQSMHQMANTRDMTVHCATVVRPERPHPEYARRTLLIRPNPGHVPSPGPVIS